MTPGPPTAIRADTLAGRFTYEGKPLKRAAIQLRSPTGVLIGRSATDASGRFQFHPLRSGVYEVRMLRPSVEAFTIRFEKTSGTDETFNVNFFGDYCYRISALGHPAEKDATD
jgi:hypothetical protein